MRIARYVLVGMLVGTGCAAPRAREMRWMDDVPPVQDTKKKTAARDGSDLPTREAEIGVADRLDGVEDALGEIRKKLEDEDPPVWWSTGVGWATSVDADPEGNEFSSVMFHFKGYPWRVGRARKADRDGADAPVPADFFDEFFTTDRLFVSAGISIGKVGGSDLVEGPLYALGAGFDVTPEFGLIAGVSFFEEDEMPGKDIESSFFYGVVIEVPLFERLFR